jgi:hypothetical protein
MKNRSLFKLAMPLLASFMAGCDPGDTPDTRQKSGTIETFAGSVFGYEGDGGKAKNARLGYLTGVATDASGHVYFTDGAANTVRQISKDDGKLRTIAGTFLGFNVIDPAPFAGDGGLAKDAHFNVPMALAISNGEVVIADAGNMIVRQINSSGTINTIAGKPFFMGYSGDGDMATQAVLANPYSVALDGAGNIYIADAQNHAVRMITRSTGKISTIAGLGPDQPGYSGDDGPAMFARLTRPNGIATDLAGNIFISDTGNNVIRKISDGIITTIAGTGAEGYSGDGSAATSATFVSLKGIAVDSEGNVYIADSGNNAIRKITTSTGTITTVAGTGVAGYSGDGGAGTLAQLSNPLGVAIDAEGTIYIADTGNSVIRSLKE